MSDMSDFSDEPLLVIEIFDGEYFGDESELTHICDVEGSVPPDGRPPFTVLEETARVLELCADKYSTPAPAGDALTVFIGRRTRGATATLARLDVQIEHGLAHASIVCSDRPREDAEPVPVSREDDVVTVARKIFAASLGGLDADDDLIRARLKSVGQAVKVNLDDM